MSDLIDEAHEFLCIMDKQEYADEVYRLRARVAELEAQIAGLRALCARLQAWHDAVVEQPSFTNKYTYIRRPAPFEDK